MLVLATAPRATNLISVPETVVYLGKNKSAEVWQKVSEVPEAAKNALAPL